MRQDFRRTGVCTPVATNRAARLSKLLLSVVSPVLNSIPNSILHSSSLLSLVVHHRTNAIRRQSQCNHRDRPVEVKDPVPNKSRRDPFAPEELCARKVVEDVDLTLEADEAIALEAILSRERLSSDADTETTPSLGAL